MESTMKKLLLAVAALIVLTTASNAAAKNVCVVADPTDTPLNVRKAPNGTILGALHNDTLVAVNQIVMVGGKKWARIVPATTGNGGWVFLDYLDCN
jgi:hypothetical protein